MPIRQFFNNPDTRVSKCSLTCLFSYQPLGELTMEKYRVVLNTDGINRNYVCESYFDAVILFDMLTQIRTYRLVEIWEDKNFDTRPVRQSFYGRV